MVGGSRIICEAWSGRVLTVIGRQGDVGKRGGGLASVENMEEVDEVGISLGLLFNMM